LGIQLINLKLEIPYNFMLSTRLVCPCCLYITQLLRLRRCQRGGLLPRKIGLTGLLGCNNIPDPLLLGDLQMHSCGAKGLSCFRLSGHDKPIRLTTQALTFVCCSRQRRRCL